MLFAVLALVWLSAERGSSAEYLRSSQVFVGGTIACAALLAATASLDTRLAVWLLLDLLYLAGLSAVIGTAFPGLTITPALIEHAHDGRTAASIAWLLCAATVVALAAAMALSASLEIWRVDRALYRPVARARACAVVGVLCLALAVARPAPLPLGLALVALLGVPWGVAVIRQTANDTVDE
ncbi:hypothetical protein [Streptomyces mirabilis]|uniref:hypothetical protein n=1 Tax=Streptomyces mirabilis TaxID=68239 RepID=UPI0036C5C411